MENTALKVAYKAIENKQGENIRIIDMQSVNPLIDYFVIASANNPRKANAIIEEIYDCAQKENLPTRVVHNSGESGWLVADLESVICHIFIGDERFHYNLEGLWKDLPEIAL